MDRHRFVIVTRAHPPNRPHGNFCGTDKKREGGREPTLPSHSLSGWGLVDVLGGPHMFVVL